MEVNIVKFEGKPVEKLITTVSEAIGILYEPRRIRKKGEAEAYALEQMNKAKANGALLDAETNSTIEERAKSRLMLQEVQRQDNIESILDKSIKYLGENADPTPVNSDWRARFFTRAQEVSNEDLQEIWAKLIAEEVTSPGKLSLKTLDIISNLSSDEAKAFERLCRITFENGAILSIDGKVPHKEFGVTFYDLVTLQSAGLVMQDEVMLTLPKIASDDQQGYLLADGKRGYLLVTDDKNKGRYKVANLTKYGAELKNLLIVDMDTSYISQVLTAIRNSGVTIETLELSQIPKWSSWPV